MDDNSNILYRTIVYLVLALTFGAGVFLLFVSSILPWDSLETVARLLGAFLCISVPVSFLYSLTLKRFDAAERRQELSELMDEKLDQLVKGHVRFGVNSVVPRMEFQAFFDNLGKGDEIWWLDTYDPGSKLWMDNLIEATNRGLVSHFLVLKPNSANANHRQVELGDLYKNFSQHLSDFIEDLNTCISKASNDEGGKIVITQYEDLPCMPIYLHCRDGAPKLAYTSFFLSAPTGVEFPHIVWTPGEGEMLQLIHRYVTEKWERNEDETDETDET